MGARRRTATSNFGAGARQSHDATRFYERFRSPELSTDDAVVTADVAEPFVHGDARHMAGVPDSSVALVVTSPPYFAGKQYEEELEREGVPSSYLEYLELLTAVFADCVRTLEPGGRIAVNVANLGRKPYRSLSADVIRILEHDLGLLLRGEIIWQKGEGANGSCAWGSYRAASNPVLRDITERIIVASKGRFDRARPAKHRKAEGMPHESTLATDDFLALTLDVWSIPPESVLRVGHPAPFPVELPEQLIRLYTYAGDLVLDPFMGSGSTLVAAAGLGRRYVGYDLDADYVAIARRRVAELGPDVAAAAPIDGRGAERIAAEVVTAAGFTIAGERRRIAGTGVVVDLVLTDATGATWHADVAGSAAMHRGGLLRSDVVWRVLGRATALRGRCPDVPVLVLTTDLPKPRSEGDVVLRAARGTVFDVIDLHSEAARARLEAYATKGPDPGPVPGYW